MDGTIEGPAGRYTLLSVVTGRDRQRRVLLAGSDTTVGELAGLLGADAEEPLWVDGCQQHPEITLTQAGVVTGSVVGAVHGTRATVPTARTTGAGGGPSEPVVAIRCTAGPAAGVRVPLGAGRHVLGRSPVATVRIRDPAVELHAVLLDVAIDGRIVATQLTGSVPVTLDGEIADGPQSFAAGSVMHVGASRIECEAMVPRTPARLHAAQGDSGNERRCSPSPWLRYWHRRDRTPQRWTPAVSPCRGSAGGVERTRCASDGSPAGPERSVGAFDAGVIATALVFAVLVAIGVFGAPPGLSVMWPMMLVVVASGIARAAFRVARRNRERQARSHRGHDSSARWTAALDRQCRSFLEHHRRSVPAIDAMVETADIHGAALWERRADHDDAFTVALGYGPVEWTPVWPQAEPSVRAPASTTDVPDDVAGHEPRDLDDVRRIHGGHSRPPHGLDAWYSEHVLHDERVPFALAAGSSIAIAGNALAVARSIVIQLAVAAGPADWELLVVTNRRASWEWCRWLPHVRDECVCNVADLAGLVGLASVLVPDGGLGATPRHLVVIVDAAGVSDPVIDQLAGILGDERPRATIVLADDDEMGALGCQAQLTVGSRHRGLWTPDTERAPARWPLHATGVTDDLAWQVALSLASLVDPELPGHGDAFVPLWTSEAPTGESARADEPCRPRPFG